MFNICVVIQNESGILKYILLIFIYIILILNK